MLTYHLKSLQSLPIFYRIHNLRICSPVISSICTPPVAFGHGTAGTTDFSASIRHSTHLMSGAVPPRGSRTPAPVSGQRFSWYGLHHTADMRLFLRRDRSETSPSFITVTSIGICGCCLFAWHSFHLGTLYFTPNGETVWPQMCHHIVRWTRF